MKGLKGKLLLHFENV